LLPIAQQLGELNYQWTRRGDMRAGHV